MIITGKERKIVCEKHNYSYNLNNIDIIKRQGKAFFIFDPIDNLKCLHTVEWFLSFGDFIRNANGDDVLTESFIEWHSIDKMAIEIESLDRDYKDFEDYQNLIFHDIINYLQVKYLQGQPKLQALPFSPMGTKEAFELQLKYQASLSYH